MKISDLSRRLNPLGFQVDLDICERISRWLDRVTYGASCAICARLSASYVDNFSNPWLIAGFIVATLGWVYFAIRVVICGAK